MNSKAALALAIAVLLLGLLLLGYPEVRADGDRIDPSITYQDIARAQNPACISQCLSDFHARVGAPGIVAGFNNYLPYPPSMYQEAYEKHFKCLRRCD